MREFSSLQKLRRVLVSDAECGVVTSQKCGTELRGGGSGAGRAKNRHSEAGAERAGAGRGVLMQKYGSHRVRQTRAQAERIDNTYRTREY